MAAERAKRNVARETRQERRHQNRQNLETNQNQRKKEATAIQIQPLFLIRPLNISLDLLKNSMNKGRTKFITSKSTMYKYTHLLQCCQRAVGSQACAQRLSARVANLIATKATKNNDNDK